MKKALPLICFLLFAVMGARAQTIGFFDMSDMVRLTSGQVDNLLIKTGKFKLNNKEVIDGKTLNTYQTIDKNKKAIKGETLVVGNYVKNKNGDKLHILTYNSVYPTYITNLMKQMEGLGYKLSLSGSDVICKRFVYDNPLYHVIVIMKHDLSINSIEIREKDYGIE